MRSREVLEAYRMVAQSAGWLTQVREAINDGLTAETAVDKVARNLRDRMRRIADPYLRERLADIEDMIGRLMVALGGMAPKPERADGLVLLVRRLGPGGPAGLACARHCRRRDRGGQPLRPCRDPGARLGLPALAATAARWRRPMPGMTRCSMPKGRR